MLAIRASKRKDRLVPVHRSTIEALMAYRDLPARTICLPLFAPRADHVTEDLPNALAGAGFQGVTLPPVGMADAIPALIAESIRAALNERP